MSTAYQEYLEQAVNFIARAHNILVLTHVPVDGDGLASAIAVFQFLRRMGKTATVICPEAIPEIYHFLPGVEEVRNDAQGLRDCVVSVDLGEGTEIDNVRYAIEENRINIVISPRRGEILPEAIHFRKNVEGLDLIITLDAPTKQSLGPAYESNIELFYSVPVINVDHHVENSYYGKVNLVDVSAASTTEILVDLMAAFPSETAGYVDEDVATLLLSGLITDTMSFQNARTTPRALHLASSLLQRGARQQEIIRHFYKTKKLSTLKLWGKILGGVEHHQLLRLLWSSYSYRDLQEFSAAEKEVNGIMDNLLCNAPGMEVVLLFYEKSPSETHVFLKPLTDAIDAQQIAAALNSSFMLQDGHLVARTSLSESKTLVLETLNKLQQERLGVSTKYLEAFNAGLALPADASSSSPAPDPTLPEVRLPELEAKLGG